MAGNKFDDFDGMGVVESPETASEPKISHSSSGKRRTYHFIKGPLPKRWLLRALVHGGPSALAVLLLLKLAADVKGWRGRSGTVVVSSKALFEEAKLSPRTQQRALAALEQAGMIRIERRPGRLRRVILLPPEQFAEPSEPSEDTDPETVVPFKARRRT